MVNYQKRTGGMRFCSAPEIFPYENPGFLSRGVSFGAQFSHTWRGGGLPFGSKAGL